VTAAVILAAAPGVALSRPAGPAVHANRKT